MLKMNIELVDTLTSLSEQINAIAYSLPSLNDEHRNIFFGELMYKSDQLTQQLKSIDLYGNSKAHNLKSSTFPQNTFGERLKFALKEQGMTQGVLADWTGISQSTISSMATGKIKNIDTPRAEAIAKALDVSFVWLMHGEGGIYGTQPESLKLQAARLKFSGHNIEV